MNRIMVEASVETQLVGLIWPVEVVDATGRSLGLFVPAQTMRTSDECPYSAEDLSRMRNAQGGRPLAEIWRSMGAK
jgi:hypothetical protein